MSLVSRRLALALASLLPAVGGAQGAPAFDPVRLARLDSTLAAMSADRRIPGAVLLLVKDGRVVHHAAFGTRDVRTGEPLRRDDIFRMASQTKAIVSVAAMVLVEEGRLVLDAPVARYLPEFERPTVLDRFNPADSSFTVRPARRTMTVKQLLTHTSGLDYAGIGSEELKAVYAKAGVSPLGGDGTLAERVRTIARLPLRAEPGERWIYSLSTDVLGRVVEVVSGMPLDRFVRERVTGPLGMRDTHFELPAASRARLVRLHRRSAGGLEVATAPELGLHPEFPARPVTDFSGGGGMSGTIADYGRFLQMLANGGELDGVRVLGRKTVEHMLANHTPGQPIAFGLGVGLETAAADGATVLSAGSYQWGGAFGTTYWVDPKEKLVALCYTNVWPSTPWLESIVRTMVYAALR